MPSIEKKLFDPILFDLDGTLIDSGRDIAISVNLTLDEINLPRLSESQIIRFVGNGVRELLQKSVIREPNADESLVEQAVRIFKHHYNQNCLVHTRPYPGVMEMLAELQGVMKAVVTNKRSDFTKTILDGLNLSAYFDAVVAGDETKFMKPNPEPLLLACQRMGTSTTGGIMIGDMANDILAGKNADMATCGVLWGLDQGGSLLSTQPDFTCTSMRELCRILRLSF